MRLGLRLTLADEGQLRAVQRGPRRVATLVRLRQPDLNRTAATIAAAATAAGTAAADTAATAAAAAAATGRLRLGLLVCLHHRHGPHGRRRLEREPARLVGAEAAVLVRELLR